MKRLFLHVGTHKTGTTSIQKFCANRNDVLAQLGLWYPNYRPGAKHKTHHDFFKALVDDKNSLRGMCKEIAEYWYSESNSRDVDLFVSAEPIYRLVSSSGINYTERQRDFLYKIKDILSNFEVVPVVVYREHSSFIESLYSEQIANGGINGSFDLLDYSYGKINPLLNYSDFLENLNEVFDENTISIQFESLFYKKPLIYNFFSKLGFESESLNVKTNSRKSLDIPSVRLKECINPQLKVSNKKGHKRVIEYLTANQRTIKESIRRTLFAVDGYHLWGSEERKKMFIESVESDRDRLTSLVDFPLWQTPNFNYSSVFLPPYDLLNLDSDLIKIKENLFKMNLYN